MGPLDWVPCPHWPGKGPFVFSASVSTCAHMVSFPLLQPSFGDEPPCTAIQVHWRQLWIPLPPVRKEKKPTCLPSVLGLPVGLSLLSGSIISI